jgi:hypothetical protein
MRKVLLIILLICLSASAFAQSGVFMDKERNGEGITLFNWANLHQEQTVTFYFYTYGNQNQQRWFFGSDPWDGKTSTGILYITTGLNYPEGIPSDEPFEEDVVIVGTPVPVGTYTLISDPDGGYQMWVEEPEIGPKIDVKDYLYDRAWYFTYPLIQIK